MDLAFRTVFRMESKRMQIICPISNSYWYVSRYVEIYRFIDAAQTDFSAIAMTFFSLCYWFFFFFIVEWVLWTQFCCMHLFFSVFRSIKKTTNVNNTGGDFSNSEWKKKWESSEYIANLFEWEISIPVAKQRSQKSYDYFRRFFFFPFLSSVCGRLAEFLGNFTFHIGKV